MTAMPHAVAARDRSTLSKVLIANRGEIAVRIIRACIDADLRSVAVYADADRDCLFVQLADEAFALGGTPATETYLDIDKLIDVAIRSGADGVHPGYGFLSENPAFAQAVLDAGLTWIGPPPAAIEALGDKVSARHLAQRAGAPLVPGTADPVASVDEVLAFADDHGLPIAIKAAFGGGGRGIKVARARADIPELYESAVREAKAAFGRGECFVERYLDAPRHVETQCLVDTFGTVAVLSTRDCSIQRRHQKLVEEAPAPFLTPEQQAILDRASRAILREAGYVGAATCEFLVCADGDVSFLEVNTRLQVEHPVTEEITGIDLVREQFRIAAGEALGYESAEVRGHAIEFRVNGEDPTIDFMPTPGTITQLHLPAGPGVRVDSGVREGDVVSCAFDSLLAKLIITGATRTQAIERARRALAEFEVVGLPTVLPFHRALVREEAFAPADPATAPTVHTRWIETEFADRLPSLAHTPKATPQVPDPAAEPERVVVEVGGKRLEVVLPQGFGKGSLTRARTPARRPPKRSAARPSVPASSSTALTSPMQGTIVKVAVDDGAAVTQGDLIVVLEAMKMEQPLTAHRSGRITNLSATIGATVSSGTVICDIA